MPVFTAIATSIFAGTALAGTWIVGATAFGLRVATGVGMSLAAQELAGKQAPQALAESSLMNYGVRGTISRGGDVPRSFPLGWRQTAGSLVYANTWGSENDTPNAYLTYVIALSDIPLRSGSDGLVGFYVNGAKCIIEWDNEDLPRGFPVTEYTYNGTQHLWVKFYDGTQVAADPLLVDTIGGDDRPYESTRVGVGVAYAVVTARVNAELWSGFPQYKFELTGIKLYDITKDSTAGGSGAQRWSNPSTWGGDGDDLPAVQIYNILRGISYDDEWMYGLQGMVAARLPAVDWIAAIEKCRAEVAGPDGDEPTYRSSLEVFVNQPPVDTSEQLLTACQGRLAEIGGFYKLYVGAPDSPVMAFDDDDIISTQEQSFSPFFGLARTINGITGTYPEPEEGWNNKTAPPLYRSDLEVLAGNRRLLADPRFDAVPYARQVQQLMKEALQEAQRARRHTLVLPPSYWPLEPGDIVAWTSARNGYVTKLFRVDGVDDRADLDVMVDLTEVDPDDYDFDFDADYDPPVIGPLVQVLPPAQLIIDFAAVAVEVTGDGVAKRPGIQLSWSASVVDDIAAVQFEVRRASDGEVIIRDRVDDVAAGGAIIVGNGLLPATDYEVRARYIPKGGNRATLWSDWIAVTTTDTRFEFADLAFAELDLIRDSIWREIEGVKEKIQKIAASVTQQDSHNWTDKQETRTLLQSVNENHIANTKAQVEVVQSAVTAVDAALASFQITVGATYATKDELTTSIAGVNSTITTFASGYATLAAYDTEVTAAYQDYADAAQAAAEATAASALSTFASGYASLATYNTAVTAAYQGYADDAADAAQAAAEATAASALSTFASGYASLATYNTAVTAAYQGYADDAADAAQAAAEATAASNLTAFADGHASLAEYETYLRAELDDQYALLTFVSSTYVTQAGIAAFHGLTLDVNGYVVGYKLWNSGDLGAITFNVDYFQVAKAGVSGGAAKTVFEIGTVSGAAAIKFKGNMYGDGDIAARNIAAKAITTSKLAIASAVANLCTNGDFEDGINGWTKIGAAGTIAHETSGSHTRSGAGAIKLSGTVAESVLARYELIPVEPSKYYELAAWAKASSAAGAGFYLRAFWYQADGTTAASTTFTDAVANVALTTSYALKSARIQAPANAAYARVGFYKHLSSVSDFYVDDVSFKPAVRGTLIEDGVIKGDHLEVDTITVREILSGSATALADATGATESDNGDLSTDGFTLVQVTMTLVTGNVVVFFDAAANFDDGAGTAASRSIILGLYVGAVEKETRTFTGRRVVIGGTEGVNSNTAWPLLYECAFDGSLAFMARLTGLSAGSTTFYVKIKNETFSAGSGWSGEVRTPRIAVFESRR